jgi:hypothetical protein
MVFIINISVNSIIGVIFFLNNKREYMININKEMISMNFGDIAEGTFFFLSSKSIQCEKLANNLAEDENGNIVLLVSSEPIIIQKEKFLSN